MSPKTKTRRGPEIPNGALERLHDLGNQVRRLGDNERLEFEEGEDAARVASVAAHAHNQPMVIEVEAERDGRTTFRVQRERPPRT